jgi:hypothetical protein
MSLYPGRAVSEELSLILLSFLIPPAIYLLTLAFRNRSRHPFLLAGHWDFVGVVFALSGFLLFGGPAILQALYHHWRIDWTLGRTRLLNGLADHWLFWASLWTLYFVLVTACVTLLISRRRNQTSIYNLEPDDFAPLFTVVLKRLGLEYSWEQPDRVVLGEPEAAATVEVESFPAMRHVTLHWSGVFDRWRAAVEEELALALKRTPAANGPVSYWFLAGSLLLFVLAITLLARLILSFLHSPW